MDTKNSITRLFGLIGYPLSHSFSQKYFRNKFSAENITDADYLNFEIENISQITQVINENKNLKGFNVTIPYKEKILKFLDEIDPDAEKIGAVNTVKCIKTENGNHLKGFNTDFYGFDKSLNKLLKGSEKKALILGNGGAAKAIIYALKKMNIQIIVATRQPTSQFGYFNYSQIDQNLLNEIDIIVNTTPLGMWPNVNQYPSILYSSIKKNTIVYDIIYNPAKTMFMEMAEKNGAIVLNGLEMLNLQAEKAWEIFNEE